MIRLCFFASLAERLGIREEQLALPAGVHTVGELAAWLQQRDATWQQALADSNIRAALNHEVVSADATLSDGDEVAWFPPMTGG